jgi:hypothetical protein
MLHRLKGYVRRPVWPWNTSIPVCYDGLMTIDQPATGRLTSRPTISFDHGPGTVQTEAK